MTYRDSSTRRTSFAGRDPDLRRNIPESLARLRALRPPFDHARDPLISAQLNGMKKTEAQRREESGRGSSMVRLHRPFPDLRPKHEQGPLRASFNQAWLREQRVAKMAQFKAQRTHAEPSKAPQQERTHKMQEPER